MIKESKQIRKKLSLIIFVIIFGIIYLQVFSYLENRIVSINIIHTELDEMIPFCKYFIIPYLFWFAYVGVTMIYFLLYCEKEKEQYSMLYSFCAGIFVFILISWLYPNGHILRPELIGDDFWTNLVRMLHSTDTPTNILPSLHVFETVVCSIALLRQNIFLRSSVHKIFIILVTVSIILSTMFLKQHSIIDVVFALFLNSFCYWLFYRSRPMCQENVNFRASSIL